MNEVKGLPEKLKELRKSKKYTQKKWAKIADVSINTVKNLENGSSSPTANNIQSYCTEFGVSPNYIFGAEDNPSAIQHINSAIAVLDKAKALLQGTIFIL